MTDTLYHVAWRSTITGTEGRGDASMPEATAQRIADEMNAQFPMLHHYIVPSEDRP